MEKQRIRDRVWDELQECGVARFPFPPHGRIPNFDGADAAADRLAGTPEWKAATTLKANPDAPQLPVRRRALREGKTVYMAVPRLRAADCFVELDPAVLEDPDAAATVSGMDEHGTARSPTDLPRIDLIVAGSVAVTETGVRIGKGEGYSDLEYAVLSGFEKVDEGTPVTTTVHERQVVNAAPAPADHDVPIDLVVTPDRVIRTEPSDARPAGIDWSLLDDEQVAEMPVLKQLRSDR